MVLPAGMAVAAVNTTVTRPAVTLFGILSVETTVRVTAETAPPSAGNFPHLGNMFLVVCTHIFWVSAATGPAVAPTQDQETLVPAIIVTPVATVAVAVEVVAAHVNEAVPGVAVQVGFELKRAEPKANEKV